MPDVCAPLTDKGFTEITRRRYQSRNAVGGMGGTLRSIQKNGMRMYWGLLRRFLGALNLSCARCHFCYGMRSGYVVLA
eukprot:9104522-Pyramimonas_sp.AAC.1